mmetsp:Transcript_39/g.57  ORF Transcript_39/g.57 Transcript_39/m.57 type:complete len:146 (+) Transcript_39:244-681(+)|eukprot:CAMPEP_0194220596 /NCGR_PEP_ID=MMETSP0156-20130528/28790_1 /TAXON_ID=33649 /ORGANISM="Thalassionema nitzschioides, Strain L26-B" /LENGTH=145 /DNA_ID=CAMNT_0038950695 /DNA_START=173 /DNA_END=610 /DNA_ORIENTATION=+
MSERNNPFADDASQASKSSLSGSLLDRIRAQREQEANAGNNHAQPEPLSVPNYSPTETDLGPAENSSGWMMGFKFPRLGGTGQNDATTSLLAESGNNEDAEEYSMMNYFQTFVQDVYGGFRSLHPVVQGFLVLFWVVIAFKLLVF